MQIITTLIETGWELAERIPPGREVNFREGGDKNWIPATVPGHVHLDLMTAGVIGDPFYRMQEAGCRWVDDADWVYRTTFAVDAVRLAAQGEQGRHFLHFHGLDTLARIYLNGEWIGATDNFFIPYRFDVTERLREGANELRVEFDSALRFGQQKADAYLGDGTSERGQQSYFNFGPRAFVRKPQYMFGWDWGPELVSCGIWQPVELITVPAAEITDWRMEYTFTDPITVDIKLTLTVEKYVSEPLLVGASLYAPGDNTPSVLLPEVPGTHTVNLHIQDQKVALWNPNGLHVTPSVNGLRPKGNAQRRYLLNLKVTRPVDDPDDEPEVLAHKGVTIGFRTVELVREMDADGKGESFQFRVNGVDLFIKGANWIPEGTFPGAISETRLRERLTQARDAGFNMLRVWGGGLYESETFYNLCDELGILVWQDFAFACSMYPDDEPAFVENVHREAIAAVRRIRHRPSLALWCGGNENAELFQGRWAGPTQATRFFGGPLIEEVLPSILADEDPHTPYWPNSPYGGENVTSEDYGDSHYWNVWHSKKPGSNGDWTNYAESTTRFSSEFGFAAPAGASAWESCTLPEDREVRSLVSRAHDKTRKGYETYLGFIAMHYPTAVTWDDLLYYGQANQADALRFGVEHWRRLKGRCWGTLFWQLNDCWPTHSWAVIDSAGEPKAAYYATKRFYAPILLSLVRIGDTIEAHVVNDTLETVPVRITARLLSFTGEEWERATTEATVPANATSGALLTLSLSATLLDRSREGLVHVALSTPDGVEITDSVLLLAEPKDLRLPSPDLRVEVTSALEKGQAIVSISTTNFAGYVRLHLNIPIRPTYSDNWFHLIPGASRTVTLTNLPADLTADTLRERLQLRCLGSHE